MVIIIVLLSLYTPLVLANLRGFGFGGDSARVGFAWVVAGSSAGIAAWGIVVVLAFVAAAVVVAVDMGRTKHFGLVCHLCVGVFAGRRLFS